MQFLQFFPPKKLPEANIQAELYKFLKENNIPCVLEYRLKPLRLRADVAIIKNGRVIGLCEIKSYKTRRPFNYCSKQMQKYGQCGIPMFGCGRMEDVPRIAQDIIELYQSIS